MSYKIDYCDGGYTAYFSGNITIEEINLANGEVHGHPHFDSHRYQIVNFLDADLNGVSEDDVLIPAAIDKVAAKTTQTVKVAIVANQIHSMTLAQYFVTSAQHMEVPWKFRVFPELTTAEQWAKK